MPKPQQPETANQKRDRAAPPCRFCGDLHETVNIDSSDDLEKQLIRAAKRVSRGVLKELTVQEEPVSLDGGLSLTAPYPYLLSDMVVRQSLFKWKVLGWGDYVALGFQCTHCGAVFSLRAETYHGGGGTWEYVQTPAP